MKKTYTSKHHMSTLFVILLFGIFAVSVLMVLFSGTGVYKKVSQHNHENYNKRICSQYFVTRIHKSTAIEAAEVYGNPALVVHEELDGYDYATYIYYYDGYIREFFGEPGVIPKPEYGEKIIEADGLEFDLTDGLLKSKIITIDAQTIDLTLNVKHKEAGKNEE